MSTELEPKPPRRKRIAKPRVRRLKPSYVPGELQMRDLNWRLPSGTMMLRALPRGVLHQGGMDGHCDCFHWIAPRPQGFHCDPAADEHWLIFDYESRIWEPMPAPFREPANQGPWLAVNLEHTWIGVLDLHPALVEFDERAPGYAN